MAERPGAQHGQEAANAGARVKRRGILAAAGAVVAGLVAKQVSEPVAAAVIPVVYADNPTTIITNPLNNSLYLYQNAGFKGTFAPATLYVQTTADGIDAIFAEGIGGGRVGVVGTGGIGQPGIQGNGGSGNANGIEGRAAGNYTGVVGYGGPNGGPGMYALGGPQGGGTAKGAGLLATTNDVPNPGGSLNAGLYAAAVDGMGAHGVSTSGYGVMGSSATGIGVVGASSTSAGVYGNSSGPYGVAGGTTAPGGYGGYFATAANNSYGFGAQVQGTPTGSVALYANAPANNYAAYLVGDVYINGSLTVADMTKKHGLLRAPDGTHHLLYTMEAPESWAEDFGTGTLVNGKATVALEPLFASLVQTEKYHVFAVSHDGGSKGLAVTGRHADRFEVTEHSGGTSSGTFSYRVVAKPKGGAVERLGKYVVPAEPREPPPLPKITAPPPLPTVQEPPAPPSVTPPKKP